MLGKNWIERRAIERGAPVDPLYAIISPELDAWLEELAQRSGHSKAELIQSGLALVELALTAKEKGKKFGVVEQGTPLVTEVVGF